MPVPSVLEEVVAFLRQLGAGPGADPSSAVPRFFIPSVFWLALAVVALRQWRRVGRTPDLVLAAAAAAGLLRELAMLAIEYGSHRGLFPFAAVVPWYPPAEHAVELATQAVAGFAFLSAFRGVQPRHRLLLRGGLGAVTLLYAATASSWASAARALVAGPGARPEFAQHWGDAAFRVVGGALLSAVVVDLALVRGRGRAPRLAAVAFAGFLADHLLMLVNIGTGLRHAWVLAPIRHNLHMWAVPALVGVYWLELAEEVRRSQERLALVLEGSAFGFWDWDLSTRELVIGDRGAALLGYAPAELPSRMRSWRSLVHPEDLFGLDHATYRVLHGEQALLDREVRILRRDGSWCWVEVRGRAVARAPDGRPLRAAGTLRDVTAEKAAADERRALEGRMQQAQKLKSLGLLAGGVAHDFNNLLTIVDANLAAAAHELAPGPAREAVAEAQEGTRRAVELTAQLLAYAGRGETRVRPIHLSREASELAVLLRTSLPRGCRLVLDCPAELPPVRADATQIRQLLMNLMLNAGQAMADRPGEVAVRTVALDCDRAMLDRSPIGEGLPVGPYVALEVSDQGAGMTEETRARIFEPFFTTKAGGRGLGLAVVLGVVQAHRGALTVESAPGKGTTFRVLLPAAGEAVRELPGPRLALVQK